MVQILFLLFRLLIFFLISIPYRLLIRVLRLRILLYRLVLMFVPGVLCLNMLCLHFLKFYVMHEVIFKENRFGFIAPTLQDVLRDAALFGSLPDVQVPMSYDDDDVSSVDDLSDIRVGRLERAESKLSAAQRQRYSSVLAARAAFEAKNDSLSTAKASETAGEH